MKRLLISLLILVGFSAQADLTTPLPVAGSIPSAWQFTTLPSTASRPLIRSNPFTLVSTGYQADYSNKIGRPNLACIAQAAQAHGVPVDLMLAIQSQERGHPSQRVMNSGARSYDIGAFQINSTHLRWVNSMGISEDDLASKGCVNAQVAANLMSQALNNPNKQSLDFFTRAAGYHSWTPSHNSVYRNSYTRYLRQWQAWLRANGHAEWVTSPTP